jgi:2,3-dihydroxybenzoate-AMP ligase
MAAIQELTEILAGLGVERGLLAPRVRLRSGLALSSAETAQLGLEFERRFGVEIDLWDAADYSLGELADRIAAGTSAAALAGAAGRRLTDEQR